MKKILQNLSLCLLTSSLFAACGKKEPEPGPGYFFKFKADGVAYYYEYETKTGFSGTRSNMGAFQSTSTAWGGTYQIYAYSRDNPTARGEVRFFLNKEDFDNLDTIVLDGVRNRVSVSNLNFDGETKHYSLASPLDGEIVITDKDEAHINGYFNFRAGNADGTILNFSDGEFFVGRTN